ncbi:MAG: DUF928 domain-containing protein [Oscillatoriales cyanobacterium C42_A2020_001]|nr:DUF928 domain-containing protein [Leptolyngbyaceae cyanobacterium C42_A2020_001]
MTEMRRVRLGAATALVCLHVLAIAPQPTWAQPSEQPLRFVPPSRPTATVLRGRIRPIPPRCPCSFVQQKPLLTGLVFSQKTVSSRNIPPDVEVWGYTTQDYPTFWFYIPGSTQRKYVMEFSLEDEKTRTVIYKTAIASPDRSGIAAIASPAGQHPLEVGKHYRWNLSTTCEPGRLSGYIPNVYGIVVRVNPKQALAAKLSTATPQQQAALYVEHGIWHDALTTLARLRQKYPQNSKIRSNWRSLLQSVDLAEMTEQPFVEGVATTAPTLLNLPYAPNQCR